MKNPPTALRALSLAAAATIAASCWIAPAMAADAFPQRPITLVVPFLSLIHI